MVKKTYLFLIIILISHSILSEGFVNKAEDYNITDYKSKRVNLVDLNGDYYLDIVLNNKWLLLNDNGKIFELKKDSNLNFNKKRKTVLSVFGDIDNDGDIDCYSGFTARYEDFDKENNKWVYNSKKDKGFRDRILLNDGTGKFRIIKTNISKRYAAPLGAVYLDFDRDGYIDLFQANDYRKYGILYGCYENILWKNINGKNFENINEKVGLETVREYGTSNSSRPSYGAGACDWNNDGKIDILSLSYGRQKNRLWKNNYPEKFTDISEKVYFDGDEIRHGKYPVWVDRGKEKEFRANGNTFSVAPMDYDNDGDIDLFVGEITHAWAGSSSDLSALLINTGKKNGYKFVRIKASDINFPRKRRKRIYKKHGIKLWNNGDLYVSWIDYNRDMLPDLIIGSSDYPDKQRLKIYKQLEDHSFKNVTDKLNINWEGVGGISVGDVDRDGDKDILVGKSFMRLNKKYRKKYLNGIDKNVAGLWINETENDNNWLGIFLRGKGENFSNKFGIGARVKIYTPDGTIQTREIYGGNGHCGQQNPPEILVGLKKNKTVEKVEIFWPNKNNSVQIIKNVKPNQYILIRENEKGFEEIEFE